MSGRLARLKELARTEAGSLLSDTAVVFAIRLLAAVVTYATQVAMARWMGASDLGIVVYAMSWLWILGLVAGLGLGSAANRYIPAYSAAGDVTLIRGFMRFSRRVVIATGFAMTAAGIAIVAARPGPVGEDPALAYLLAVVAIPAVALNALNNNIARAFLWFAFASITGVLLRPALLLAAILVAAGLAVEASPGLVMGLLLVTILTVTVVQFFGLRRRYPAEVANADLATQRSVWLRVGLPIVLAELFVNYYVDVNILISGIFLPSNEIAVYNAALRTVAIIAFGIAAVGLATAPRAARLYAEGDLPALQRLVNRSTHLMLWPATIAFVGLVVTGRWILGLFGPEFVSGYTALVVTAAAQVVIAAAGPLLPLLNVTGNHHRALVVCAAALVLTPLLYVALMPRYGLLGGAVAFMTTGILFSGWLAVLVWRHVGIRPLLMGALR